MKRGEHHMRELLGKYWVEVIFGLGLVLGIYLLVEDVSIWAFVLDVYQSILFAIRTFSSSISQAMTVYVSSLELSDLVGFVMVIGAVVILLVRARRRYLQSDRYVGRFCPICGNAIVRLHRTRGDQILSQVLFFKFHRYRCGNQECDWAGLRKPGRTRSYI